MKSIGDTFSAEAAVFDATVGHGVKAEGGGVVDDEASDFNLIEEGLDSRLILGEKGGVDSKLAGVDPVDGLLIFLIGLQGNNGAEDFFFAEGHFSGDVFYDARLDDVVGALASSEDGSALGFSLLYPV